MEQTVDWGLMLILAALAVGALFLCIHLGKMAFAGAGRDAPPRRQALRGGSRQAFSPF